MVTPVAEPVAIKPKIDDPVAVEYHERLPEYESFISERKDTPPPSVIQAIQRAVVEADFEVFVYYNNNHLASHFIIDVNQNFICLTKIGFRVGT
jgi:hypothetical protein